VRAMQFDQGQSWINHDLPEDDSGEDELVHDSIDDDLDDDPLGVDVNGGFDLLMDGEDQQLGIPLSRADSRHLAALRAIEIARERRALRRALEDFPCD